jgi:hypothetical protein
MTIQINKPKELRTLRTREFAKLVYGGLTTPP